MKHGPISLNQTNPIDSRKGSADVEVVCLPCIGDIAMYPDSAAAAASDPLRD